MQITICGLDDASFISIFLQHCNIHFDKSGSAPIYHTASGTIGPDVPDDVLRVIVA